jgi:hypothetical protein
MRARLLRLESLAWAALLALFAAFAAYDLFLLARPFLAGRFVVSDFFAQWSFAKFAWEGHAAGIYDAATLHPFQRDLAPTLRQTFPYPYPPSFLLYILPLGALPLLPAYFIWMGATLALYLAAVWPRGEGWLARALVPLAPAVACTLLFGQNGLLTAALLLGGLRLLPARPVLAGIAFGLLSFKPQFGVLLPVALVAAGQWRCIAAAAVTLAGLVAVSVAAFGWALWPEWLVYLPVHADYLDTAVNSYRKPTLQAALLLAGADPGLARAVPLVVLALAVPVVWWAFRTRRALAPAILVAASLAGAPYAFIYDLPALTGVALAALGARPASATRLADDAIIALALAIPATMTLTTRFYWTSCVALVLLFALVTLRARAPR